MEFRSVFTKGRKMNFNFEQPHHYYLANVGEWRVCDPNDLPTNLVAMQRSMPNCTVAIFLVPGNKEDDYKIKNYSPQVEGAVLIFQTQSPKETPDFENTLHTLYTGCNQQLYLREKKKIEYELEESREALKLSHLWDE